MDTIRRRPHVAVLVLALGLVTAAGCGDDPSGPSGADPTITAISPADGTVGTEVRITGTDFRPEASAFFGEFPADTTEVVDSGTIFARVPADVVAGTAYDVTVRNSDGTEVTLASAFTPIAPALQYVNSATKPSGNIGSTVILEGKAFGDVQGSSQVLFSDGMGGRISATIASPDDWTDTFVVTTVPSGTASGDVTVETVLGTSGALPFLVTEAAAFSPSAIAWSPTTDLPDALSGHEAVFVATQSGDITTNFVHVSGGEDSLSTTRSEVRYAEILSGGAIGSWTETATLPGGRAFHASVAATPFNSKVGGSGYLYILGGITTSGGQPTMDVYRGELGNDGSVTGWTGVASLPIPLHSHGAVIFRSSIYVAGGSTTDNDPVADVYRAQIDSLGNLEMWEALPSLPSGRSYHRFTSFGGHLHSFGGEGASQAPGDATLTATRMDEIAYAKIDLRTGALADLSWTVNADPFNKSRSKHTAVIAGGSVLITAGLYSGGGTGSSENAYAQLNSDGSVTSFSGATGSMTITNQDGGNLFNHAAISYVDADGVAHVLALGGDDVNSPGSKHAGVWYY